MAETGQIVTLNKADIAYLDYGLVDIAILTDLAPREIRALIASGDFPKPFKCQMSFADTHKKTGQRILRSRNIERWEKSAIISWIKGNLNGD